MISVEYFNLFLHFYCFYRPLFIFLIRRIVRRLVKLLLINHNFKNTDILKYPSIKKKTFIWKWFRFKYNNEYWRWPKLLHIIESKDKKYKPDFSISYNIKSVYGSNIRKLNYIFKWLHWTLCSYLKLDSSNIVPEFATNVYSPLVQ